MSVSAEADASDQSGALAQVLAQVPLRAGAFIVTLYGDAVEPRGGRLWMGNIVEACEAVGISETLVRTAVSRLVAAGRLHGERQGRRSFYALTEEARAEFAVASRILYEAPAHAGWRFAWIDPDAGTEAATGLERTGFVRLGPQWFLGPDGPALEGPALTVFAAEGLPPSAGLRRLAAAHWNLGATASAYAGFLAAFAPLAAFVGAGGQRPGTEALTLRLLLVHGYRGVALRDPRLPAAALPGDWPGHRARHLFAGLYRALSPAADAEIGRRFLCEAGTLPRETPLIVRRLAALERTMTAT